LVERYCNRLNESSRRTPGSITNDVACGDRRLPHCQKRDDTAYGSRRSPGRLVERSFGWRFEPYQCVGWAKAAPTHRLIGGARSAVPTFSAAVGTADHALCSTVTPRPPLPTLQCRVLGAATDNFHGIAGLVFMILRWNPTGGLIIEVAQIFAEHPCLSDIRERDP
jgi:hypothetical protein